MLSWLSRPRLIQSLTEDSYTQKCTVLKVPILLFFVRSDHFFQLKNSSSNFSTELMFTTRWNSMATNYILENVEHCGGEPEQAANYRLSDTQYILAVHQPLPLTEIWQYSFSNTEQFFFWMQWMWLKDACDRIINVGCLSKTVRFILFIGKICSYLVRLYSHIILD